MSGVISRARCIYWLLIRYYCLVKTLNTIDRRYKNRIMLFFYISIPIYLKFSIISLFFSTSYLPFPVNFSIFVYLVICLFLTLFSFTAICKEECEVSPSLSREPYDDLAFLMKTFTLYWYTPGYYNYACQCWDYDK